MREELLRLEGFKTAGLTRIDLPQSPDNELESIQEKPE